MIISFDIDNTLIPYSDEFEVEGGLFQRILGVEKLRVGTKELFGWLKDQDHKVWIYTTSYRSPYYLRKLFWSYGLFPDGFVNGKRNSRILKDNHCNASKNPTLFGIDVHVDDLAGVGLEGAKYNFKTIIVDTDDVDWVTTVEGYINRN